MSFEFNFMKKKSDNNDFYDHDHLKADSVSKSANISIIYAKLSSRRIIFLNQRS